MKIIGFSALLALPLFGAAWADELPSNTIDCSQFKKDGGSWIQTGSDSFDVGSRPGLHMTGARIQRNGIKIGNDYLYDILEKKCGSH
jgi:hypothetical protein